MIVAGVVGGVVFGPVAFTLFFVIGGSVIFAPGIQSKKLLAVWRELEPLPIVSTNPILAIMGFVVLGVLTAWVYSFIYDGFTGTWKKRGSSFGLVLFLTVSVFFEFFTPLNLFGEPLPLVALELFFWLIVTQAQGLAIAYIYRPKT